MCKSDLLYPKWIPPRHMQHSKYRHFIVITELAQSPPVPSNNCQLNCNEQTSQGCNVDAAYMLP